MIYTAKYPRIVFRTLALAMATAFWACAANAQSTVTYQIGGSDLESIDVSFDNNNLGDVLAGGIQLTEIGKSSDAALPASYVTVCTDLEGTLYLGQNYTYNAPPTGFNGLSGVDPTWGDGTANAVSDGSAAAAIQNAAYLFYTYGDLTKTGLGGSEDEKAALQIAIWDVLYNTTSTGKVTGDRFNFSGADSAVETDVSSWISALNLNSNAGNFQFDGYLLFPNPESGGINSNADGAPPQELLMAMPVPEASTVIAGGLLLLPLAASAFKIRRQIRSNLGLRNQ